MLIYGMGRNGLVASPICQKVGIVVLYLHRPLRSMSLDFALEKYFEGVLFFQGFDARNEPIPKDWIRKYLPRFLYGRNLTPGEIACTFGHTEIIKTQNESEKDWIVICEDNLDFSGLPSVIKFLEGVQSNSPVLINFLSNPKYDDVRFWENIEGFTIGTNESIPTLAKCYALNTQAIKNLCSGIEMFGFQGFEPDFPSFYKLFVNFYALKQTPLRIAESQSLIGSRQCLKIDSKTMQIIYAILFILLPTNMSFWLKIKLIYISFRTKLKRKTTFENNMSRNINSISKS